MRKNSWLEQKKQFLSDYFSKKNNGIVNISLEVFNPPKENNTINKYRSWTNLIDDSKDLNPAFIMSSLDVHYSGFRTDNDKAQLILEGRCVKCKERLPKHTIDCSQHPWKTVLSMLNKLKVQPIKKTENDTSV